jgi:imidazolonepropionase
MTELSIVPKGALLIHNGIIKDVGPSHRVENLAGARHAREIDATGRVIMPAFVDADVALVTPGEQQDPGGIRVMSRRKALGRASAAAAECARYGSLAIGAHTRCAADLQNIRKLLRVHQALQSKPMRIRSIFSPQFVSDTGTPDAGTASQTASQMLDALTSKHLPAIRSGKLAGVVELTVDRAERALDISMLRAAAVVAQELGYAIRFRSSCRLEPAHLQLALAAGAIGIVAPMDTLRAFAAPLSAVGCIRVIPASEGFDDAANAAAAIRGGIDWGAAIALTSSYRLAGPSSLNMQYLLHMAVHQFGLTAEEAITATTWNPACSLRLSHVTGSLEPGKSADLLIMEVSDYRELARRAGHHDVSLVMRRGQIVVRSPALSVD